MTIDPNKFEEQGKPPYELVIKLWNEMPAPSARKLEDLLKRRGYKISFRTIARWIENGREAGAVALGHTTMVKGVKHEIAKELLNVPEKDLREADARAQNEIKQLPPPELGKDAGRAAQAVVQDEVNIIDARIKELAQMSEASLDLTEQKQRKILNIVLMEAAQRRAHVMVLIPKDTSHLVESFTTAAKQMLTGGLDQPPKAGDKNVIDGDVIDVEPETPLASAIGKFLQDEGMAG
jgi:hypothetical protein